MMNLQTRRSILFLSFNATGFAIQTYLRQQYGVKL
jgi:hypothetical protein